LWDLHGPEELMPKVKPSYRSFKAAAEHAEQLAAGLRKGRG
jgi:hypothetical protein